MQEQIATGVSRLKLKVAHSAFSVLGEAHEHVVLHALSLGKIPVGTT